MEAIEEKDDIIKRSEKRFDAAKDAWNNIYEQARDDIRFLSDDEYAQWDDDVVKQRLDAGLNCITLDKIDQTVHQVINNIRQNTPSIRVIPDGEGADDETAETMMGIIRGIEYSSRADAAYDMAAECSVKSRIGFIVVDHDYANPDGLEQKWVIKRVTNPFTCFIDPSSKEIDGCDTDWGFILESMKVSDFKAKWPDQEPVSFDAGENADKPEDDDVIMLAQYFEKIETKEDVGFDDAGQRIEGDIPEGAKSRTFTKATIKRYRLSGAAVLEETRFPGEYIPIVPVYGKEAWEDGERKLQSLISKAKSGAKLHNLWASIETDMLLKASRSPVAAAEGTFEDYIEFYKNPDKAPVLPYVSRDKQGNQLPAPSRIDPFPIPTGVVNARREAVDDIKAAMGIYNASLGQEGNETSGIAIARRQAQGDAATFHFADNLVKSIEHVGRIIVCGIGEVIDTPRVLPSFDSEGKASFVGVNGERVDGQERDYDLRKGKYSVRVTTGASYSTKRQETVAALNEMFGANPALLQTFGDIFFRNSDFAGAEALADRAEKLLPPELRDTEEGDIDPEKQQLMVQAQEMQQVIEQLGAQLQDKKAEEQGKLQIEQGKLQLDQQKLQIEAAKVENDRMKVKIEAEKAGIDKFKAESDLQLKVLEMKKKPEKHINENGEVEFQEEVDEDAERREQAAMLQAQLTGMHETMTGILQALAAPKQVVRDESGLIVGVQ